MKICPSCKSDYPGGEVFCPTDGTRLVSTSQFDGEQPDPDADPLIGTLLNDRYEILRQIGEGGMGLVYEAEHVAIEKRVALKVLRDDFSGRPEVVQRFKQEAKSASRIGNDHIVDISDFGETPRGASYFVMELLDGEDLAEVLQRDGHVDLERAANLILQCCKALSAAHAKGIVHRDMKPENIFLVDKDGHPDFVKLVDFGIAKMSDIETPGAPGRKLTKTGMIFGTPEYMSPEQAAGKELDHRVDVYALAVILFEMLTGRVPFIGDTFMGILTQHMFEDPPELTDVNPHIDVPGPIVEFIWKGLAKEADERYQSCDEMADALRGALEGQSTGAVTFVGYGDSMPSHPGRPRIIEPVSEVIELPPQGGNAKLFVGIAAAVLITAVVGAPLVYFLTKDSSSSSHGTAELGPDAGLVIAQPPPIPDAGSGGETIAEVVDAGPNMVTVSVSTTPTGAHVWVEGRGEVCDATPCSFETTAGEPITVRARMGRSEGESEIAPSENTTIQLAMARRRRGGHGGNGHAGNGHPGNGQTKNGHGGGGRGRGGGDLKIPDIFRGP